MSTKERIQAEIETLAPSELDELYELIQKFLEGKRQSNGEGILSRLAKIQIDGPEDFSVNHDLYATGAKSAKPDAH